MVSGSFSELQLVSRFLVHLEGDLQSVQLMNKGNGCDGVSF